MAQHRRGRRPAPAREQRVAGAEAEPAPSEPHSWRRWAGWALIVGAVLIAFGTSVAAPFVLDDQIAIVDNQTLRQLSPLSAALFAERESPLAARPLVNLSFAINYAIGALDPRLYHWGNIAIHLGCALLLCSVIRRTWRLVYPRGQTGSEASAFATTCALLWAVHPLNAEAVDYVTQRTELMMGFAFLLTMYCSARSLVSIKGAVWQAAGIAACACGMACKESMVVAPLAVVFYERAYGVETLREALAARWRYYAGLAATWAIVIGLQLSGPRIHSAGFASGVSWWTYLLNQSSVILRYIRLAFWPRDLVVNYGPPHMLTFADVWLSMLVVGALVLSAAALYAWKPRIGFPPLWMFLTLAPTSSVLPIATEVGAERRMYLPLAGFVVAAALCVRWCAGRFWPQGAALEAPRARQAAAVGVIALLALTSVGLSAARSREFVDVLTLTTKLVERWPTDHSRMVHAAALMAVNRHDEAIAELRQAVGGEPRARYILGTELFNKGDLEGARQQLEGFIALEPLLLEVVDAHDVLGAIAVRQGRTDEAVAHYRAALAMNSGFVAARAHLADTLLAAGRAEEAITEYQTYLRALPANVEATNNLAVALQRAGREDEAIQMFRRALQLNPSFEKSNRALAALMIKRDAYQDALQYARQVLRTAPNDPLAHDLAGVALAYQSRFEEALAELETARRLNPGDPQAREHYAAVAAQLAARRPPAGR
jgi:tetratricopeptide (TPR) repeat protein